MLLQLFGLYGLFISEAGQENLVRTLNFEPGNVSSSAGSADGSLFDLTVDLEDSHPSPRIHLLPMT